MGSPSLRDVRVLLATRWPREGLVGYLLTLRGSLEPVCFGLAADTGESDFIPIKVSHG